MTSPWDAAGAGVLRLPSGRLIRGRGLRRPVPPVPQPTFAVYLCSLPPPAVAWQARWVRWPDFWLPRDQAHTRDVLHEAWERALAERVKNATPPIPRHHSTAADPGCQTHGHAAEGVAGRCGRGAWQHPVSHGSSGYRESLVVGAYWSGKDGQRVEAHCDQVAWPGGTGGI